MPTYELPGFKIGNSTMTTKVTDFTPAQRLRLESILFPKSFPKRTYRELNLGPLYSGHTLQTVEQQRSLKYIC